MRRLFWLSKEALFLFFIPPPSSQFLAIIWPCQIFFSSSSAALKRFRSPGKLSLFVVFPSIEKKKFLAFFMTEYIHQPHSSFFIRLLFSFFIFLPPEGRNTEEAESRAYYRLHRRYYYILQGLLMVLQPFFYPVFLYSTSYSGLLFF